MMQYSAKLSFIRKMMSTATTPLEIDQQNQIPLTPFVEGGALIAPSFSKRGWGDLETLTQYSLPKNYTESGILLFFRAVLL